MSVERTYLCIDLKSFYASVECVERGLDPLTTNLVVADASRTEKTICLAVSPSLKAHGIPGRPRLFQVVQAVAEVNAQRKYRAKRHEFTGESYSSIELAKDSSLKLAYITAQPQMAKYVACSTRIYGIYLKYIAPEDIHVYSIDEVFIDLTNYFNTYKLNARELARKIIHDVYRETGVTATAGIGTNMYLAKIAMDIVAKHAQPDADGVRIAELDEISYRRELWEHMPLTDFWRVGRGYAKKLEAKRLFTMGDIARCSLGKPTDFYNEDLLYKLFGINAELLIDHAWGFEPCTMADVKAYRPSTNSVSSGQVLSEPYNFDKTRIIVREMAEHLALDLVEKNLVTDQIVLTVGFDIENLTDPKIKEHYHGEITTDAYGREVPKYAHGTANIHRATSSTRLITGAAMEIFDRIIDPMLLTRRLSLGANRVVPACGSTNTAARASAPAAKQLNFFTDFPEISETSEAEDEALAKERRVQQAMLDIKKKYGKNAILKGMNFREGATAIARNSQIGGHRE